MFIVEGNQETGEWGVGEARPFMNYMYKVPSTSGTINMALNFPQSKWMAPRIRLSVSFHINSNVNVVQGLFSHTIWPP